MLQILPEDGNSVEVSDNLWHCVSEMLHTDHLLSGPDVQL